MRNVRVKTLGNSRVSNKFQVTIPKEVRKLLKFSAGDLLVFVRDGRDVVVKRGEVRIKR
jgi:AbrB family looped-hinge helix DNA binding protein